MGDMSDLLKDGGIFIGGGVALALVKMLSDIWKARNQRAEITPQPLVVKRHEDYQTLVSCNNMMAEAFGNLNDLRAKVAAIEERMKDIAEIKNDVKDLLRRDR